MADQIINEGPWSVTGFCFNVQRWPSNMAIEELPLHKVAYWIQAHGIPLNLLTAGNALEIGEKPGERNCSSSNSQSDNSEPTAYCEWMKTRAICDSRALINTQALRGVRRRAGQIGGVNPGVLVARVHQSGDGSSEGVRTEVRAGHDRVILLEENCLSDWLWPTGRMGPISFEEHLKWAKTHIAFGKHYVTNWTTTGPLERRQNEENMGLTNEISIEPVFNSPFDTILASAYQTHHREVDEAFVRMGLKRDADP
ncbi:hypothetical protein L3X38_005329 [Prunus dulcis]|uniref:DUF4283 domain-containing protein n=1 Tax=Prunus dulcis TaxID=3755 RepID=A0AAD4ZQL4_PRUDU|nr:hypothetical protein L3X38_005329 [Prunus dulcis]